MTSAHLEQLAGELGLTSAEVQQANRRYVTDLIDAAVADNEVTDEEYDTPVRVASALDIDQQTVETRIRPYRSTERSVSLHDGMTVVFTGDHPRYERSELQQMARNIGLVPQSGVSKSTEFVAAMDPSSNSGKAAKAHRYGIPIVAVDDLLAAPAGATLRCHGSGTAALKVVTCPDCHATRTIAVTSGGASVKRCDDCSRAAAKACRTPSATAPVSGWAPPTIEWLMCQSCRTTWHRQTTRGRKPHQCPACAPTSTAPLPPPI